MESYTDNDDSAPSGTNSAPARAADEINLSVSDETADSGGQRRSTNSPTSNRNATEIRQKNPLAKFSSYTYGLTLYMFSPEAMNTFGATGKLPESTTTTPYAIIAQSGGIRNDSEPRGLTYTGIPGPGKTGLDFYIDDLTYTTYFLAADGQKTATAASSFAWKIVEPTGFTFLTRMRNLSEWICAQSRILSGSDKKVLPNIFQQHFLLGIKFYGYDVDGNMLTSNSVPDTDKILNDEFALYQRLFPVTLKACNTTINGRSTIYNMEGELAAERIAFGAKYGTLKTQANLEGMTVGEVLGNKDTPNKKSLIGWLNAVQGDLKEQNNQEKRIVYDIRWIKNDLYDSTAIANGYLITDREYARETAPMMKDVNTPKDATVKASEKAQTSNSKVKYIQAPANQTIVATIDQIIGQSSYITQSLTKEINSRIEANTKDNSNPQNFRWYAIKPTCQVLGRDSIRRDWVYNITYEIMPYEVPYVKSSYINKYSQYYGPVKLYEYTLTGGNTEVLHFEMSYNNLFFVAQPTTTTKDDSGKNTKLPTTQPVDPRPSVVSRTTGTGINKDGEIAQSIRASLYSIGDQVGATIRIMGDPDFLMDSVGSSTGSSEFGKLKAANYSINPYGGQIFVEIVFKLGEDYRNDTGLLDVDPMQSVAFYPIEVQKILKNQGMIYKIQDCVSTFSKGKFEQTLKLFMVPPNSLLDTNELEKDRDISQDAAAMGELGFNPDVDNANPNVSRGRLDDTIPTGVEVRTSPVVESQSNVSASDVFYQDAFTPATPQTQTPVTQSALDDANISAANRQVYDDYFAGGSTLPQATQVSTPVDIDLTAPAPSVIPQATQTSRLVDIDLTAPADSTVPQTRVVSSIPYDGKL